MRRWFRQPDERQRQASAMLGRLQQAGSEEMDAISRELRDKGEEGAELLAAVVERLRVRRRSALLCWLLAMASMYGLAGGAILVTTPLLWGNTGSLAPLGPSILAALIVFICVRRSMALPVAHLLACLADPRLVGAVAEGMRFADRAARADLSKSLVAALPPLGAEQFAALPPRQRVCLRRLVLTQSADVVVPLLHALARVGDVEAISFVESLLAGEGTAASDPAVKDAAREALASLQARQSREQDGARLLRPADLPDPASVFLRTAEDSAGQAVDELLRPVDNATPPGRRAPQG